MIGQLDLITIEWNVRVPTRDGASLSATIYTPAGQTEPEPLLLALSPYFADTYHARALHFARSGWPVAIVDTRGRGNSDGTFHPLQQEATDGFDAVEWLARHPTCDGRVAMWGGSFFGFTQWATASQEPPHLATIVPASAPYAGVDFPMRNNIFQPYILQWLMLTSGSGPQWKLFGDGGYWAELFYTWHVSGRPFRDLDQMLGTPNSLFQEWLSHPHPDEFWDACNPSAAQYAAIDIPVLSITGTYDDDQPGALTHYRHHRAATPARRDHFLVIGPWDHQGVGKPAVSFGGLTLGNAAAFDMLDFHLQWYGWVLKGGARPPLLEKLIAYYVMGTEEWRHADSLDQATSRVRPLYLASHGEAHDPFGSGDLGIGCSGPPDSYRYDPREIDGPELIAERDSDPRSLIDQRPTLALAGKALFYHSAPFEEDLEISGFFSFTTWLSINCPDTDLYVSIFEIGLDGVSIRLTTDGMRARYREGPRNPRLLKSAMPLPYTFDRFTFVARRIPIGHRLRLVIAPYARLIETIFTEKNFNSGGEVAAESADEGQAVTVQLFHDDAHPSILSLPLGSAATSRRLYNT